MIVKLAGAVLLPHAGRTTVFYSRLLALAHHGRIIDGKMQSVPHHPLVVMWGRQTGKGWKIMEPNRAAQLLEQGNG
jgi:hypothetical protein